jgi:hypothetical protein
MTATHCKEVSSMLLHDFRDRVEECMSMAQRTASLRDRDFLLDMARAWCGVARESDEAAEPVKRPN